VEQFWQSYSHLKHPSELPSHSDYHLFRSGIEPLWEDAQNQRGGKWICRFRKGVVSRYWEDIVLAVIGDQVNDSYVCLTLCSSRILKKYAV
jgi:translation initiation factor 4E